MESKLVAGVRSTVDDIESGAGEDEGRFDAGEVGEVLVQRNTLLSGTSLRDGNGNPEDGISTELAFVGRTVELDEKIVDFFL